MSIFNDEDHADLERREAIFMQEEFAKFPLELGEKTSQDERSKRGVLNIKCLTYGEIKIKSFLQVFKWIQKEWKDKDPDCWHNAFNVPGGTFVDLGHGTGKGILSGALMHQFERCWGMEILESL